MLSKEVGGNNTMEKEPDQYSDLFEDFEPPNPLPVTPLVISTPPSVCLVLSP